MTLDRTRWPELQVELERVEVFEAARSDDLLHVAIETIERVMGCSGCGTAAVVKDRPGSSWRTCLRSGARWLGVDEVPLVLPRAGL